MTEKQDMITVHEKIQLGVSSEYSLVSLCFRRNTERLIPLNIQFDLLASPKINGNF